MSWPLLRGRYADELNVDWFTPADVAAEARLVMDAVKKVLADAGMTVIAVSHRAVAFDRADQVLRLDAGRLVR